LEPGWRGGVCCSVITGGALSIGDKVTIKGGVFQFIVTLSPIDKAPPVMTEQQTPPLQPGSNAFLSPL
jgi:hypothetical protein